MEKKYELTDVTKVIDGHILHQIVACQRILTPYELIDRGHTGGFIEHEGNLSHDGNCWISKGACVYDEAAVLDDSYIGQNTVIYEKAIITEGVMTYGKAYIHGTTILRDSVIIAGDCDICTNGDAIRGYVNFGKNAFIQSNHDYLVIGPIGSRSGYTTFYKTKNEGIWVHCGCFNGSLAYFLKAVLRTHVFASRERKEYLKAIRYAKSVLT